MAILAEKWSKANILLTYNIGKSDWQILWNIMKNAQDSYTITIKQIVRF